MRNNLFTNLERLTELLLERDNGEVAFPLDVTLFSNNKSEAGYATYNGFKVIFNNVTSTEDEQYYSLIFQYIPEGRQYNAEDSINSTFEVRVYKYRNEVEMFEGCLFSYNVILKIVEYYVPSLIHTLLLDEEILKGRVEKELGQMRIML